MAQTAFFSPSSCLFLFLQHLEHAIKRLSCEFELNRSITAKLRNVVLEFFRKTPKNPFCPHFLAQNVIFFWIDLPFSLMAHLLQPHGQPCCEFEPNRSVTAKLQSVFLEFYRKTPKNPFFRRFFAQNVYFFWLESPFLLLAHLLQPNEQPSYKFEHHQSSAVKMRRGLVE